MFNIEWTHQPVALTESQQSKLDWEIADISEQLDSASDLIFHTVRLTDDWDGPIIIVDAKEGNPDTLFLTYYETTEWIDINIEDKSQ